MWAQAKVLWAQVRDSLWFVPATFTLLAAGLAVAVVGLEQAYGWKLGDGRHWLLGGGAEGARQALSTIAGSLITVTGVVFSVTIVALQLASSQFTPRILRKFMADRVNQFVLAALIGTFTYTLLVLRAIRSKLDDDERFVPHAAVAIAIVLALATIALLIYFIHHAARSMQAAVILSRISGEALGLVERLFPDEFGRAESPDDAVAPLDPPRLIEAAREGYLQAVDDAGLFELGRQHELLIRMATPIGSFLAKGLPLAEVWPASCDDEAVDQRIRKSFIVGEQRTPDQDLDFCLLEIADIAVKALSPGINDPTTAIHCVDRLTQVLLALGRRQPASPVRTEAGRIHFIARRPSFAETVDGAFRQIRHYGASNPVVMEKLHEAMQTLRRLTHPSRWTEGESAAP